jgi:formate dehydrogenase subunit gamma
MNRTVERFDENARRGVGAYGRTIVRDGEVLRHPVYTRILHWGVAIFFIPAMLTGLAIYSPWLYRALTPLFGGGPMTRLLHPWFSLGFIVIFALQVVNWVRPMTWNRDDRRWMKGLKSYVTNAEEVEPEYVDFFNAGQKLYFWAIVVSAVIFLVSGIPMWFPDSFGRIAVAIGYVLHDVAALVMVGGFIVHLYEGTAAQPGTLRSMTRGTVEQRWAWTHHPAWYRRAAGREVRAGDEQPRAPRAGRPPIS